MTLWLEKDLLLVVSTTMAWFQVSGTTFMDLRIHPIFASRSHQVLGWFHWAAQDLEHWDLKRQRVEAVWISSTYRVPLMDLRHVGRLEFELHKSQVRGFWFWIRKMVGHIRSPSWQYILDELQGIVTSSRHLAYMLPAACPRSGGTRWAVICQWLIILLHSIGTVIIPDRNVHEKVDIPPLYGDCNKQAIIFGSLWTDQDLFR